MLVRHFGRLPSGLVILWCFLIWYLVMVALYFEAAPRVWLNSIAMSVIVGSALMLSTHHGGGPVREFWRIFRLYAIPFCVSSFSALVRDDGFYAVFAPCWLSNLAALGACVAFLAWIALARRLDGETAAEPGN